MATAHKRTHPRHATEREQFVAQRGLETAAGRVRRDDVLGLTEALRDFSTATCDDETCQSRRAQYDATWKLEQGRMVLSRLVEHPDPRGLQQLPCEVVEEPQQ